MPPLSFTQRFRSMLAVVALAACCGALLALAPSTSLAQTESAGSAPNIATAATATHTAVDNPYGIAALWQTSDLVAKTVLILLVSMSMGSWYIIVVKLIEQSKVGRQAKLAGKTFWDSGSVREGTDGLERASPFRFIAESGIDATKKHHGLLEHVDLHTWVGKSIQRSTDRVQSSLQNGLAFLATVGSTAPFVGLFGTVWGIYHALTAIGVAGQASIDKVAGPVGEALIMTAIGLAVAVPAVLGYNWLVRRNKSAMEGVRDFGDDLHSVLLSSATRA
jgi:biopolymer transport protein ExbB